ncbi:Ifh1p [Sugiyamaella lignohabitans]|uniref:Ifh1p n=1 Tax=Sugiyamaella lignohabitans TaxID=796027 RepID=A0A167CCX6_9ASCO|nr:Ifh1p [Sugiyamaella lignohabitans]ANB11523.1 Ifh1p [Sugiyamaella lignohabitans]
MARGKSVGNYSPAVAGKSLAHYKAAKNVRYEREPYNSIGDNDSDSSPLSSLDSDDAGNNDDDDDSEGGDADEPDDEDNNDNDEDDDEDVDIGDSDITVDSAPELIIENLKDMSSDEESEDDEEEDDDNEDSDSDSDAGLVPSKFLTPLKKKNPAKAASANRKSRESTPLPVPKRLDLSELRAKQLEEEKRKAELQKPTFIDNEDDEEDEDEEEDDDDDEEDDEGSPEQVTPLQNKRRRRASIVDHSYDEKLTFPRSDSLPPPLTDVEEAIINDDEDEEEADDDEDDYDGIAGGASGVEDDSSGDEFDQDSLLAYLEQEESSPEVADEYDEEDDGHIEEQEEREIMNDMKNGDDLFSNPSSPYATTPVVESEPVVSLPEDEDEDDNDEDEISFDDDFFEPRGTSSHVLVSTSNGRNTSPSDDDDSYLWSYFFTSDEESGEDGSMISNIIPSSGNTSGTMSANGGANRTDPGYYSEDETDDDLTIPPPSLRKPGTRATEILSSSAVASRPPVLGSWDLNSERPFGIIDGLTTRTLSPPPSPYSVVKTTSISNEELESILNGANGVSIEDIFIDTDLVDSLANGTSPSNGRSRKRGRSQNGFQSDSELSELALDEFIYTDELDDVGEDDAVTDSTPLWANRFNSDVPMFAFRNRGLQPVYSQPTARRLSMSTRGRDGRRTSPKEAVITPVKAVKKRMKKKLRRRKSIQDDTQDTSGIGNTTDLIDELVESGALSPLFSGIS